MIPMTIAAGCDMFLFTKNLEEDISFMEKGYEDGVLTEERLNEAVLRILAMKAALGLPEQQEKGTICPARNGIEPTVRSIPVAFRQAQ